MNREHVMAVLYDLSLVIGGETRLAPLLTHTLQRLLYHTSYPTGLVFLEVPDDDGAAQVKLRLDAAVGDYQLAERIGRQLTLPAALVRGPAHLGQDAAPLLAALPCSRKAYATWLRLPIDGHGVMLLLAPHTPHTELPLTQIFQPVLANLAKAILLCRDHEAYAAGLIGERDLARAALGESEERFRQLANAAPDAIVMIDDDGRIAYWNPAAERMFGYAGREALGRDAHRLIVPARHLAAFERGFAAFRRDGSGAILGRAREVEALRKDGSEFPVELSVSALRLRDRWHAIGILRDITARRAAAQALHSSEARLQRAQLDIIQAVALTVEKRDPYTAGHQQKVARLAAAIAHELGWPAERIEGLRLGAAIHDIGKVYVPAEILNRPGALSEVERAFIRTHPQVGYDILKDIEFPWPVAQMVVQHHERLDGSGYPQGLADGRIIDEARVLAVADVVESMASHRPYRPAKGLDAALAEITAERGRLFEPAAVDACLRLFRERGFRFE